MSKKLTLAMALVGVVAMLFAVIGVSPAFAYGQCGGAVHNGQQLHAAWVRMGVQNSPQAHSILKAAGWRPMDGSAGLFMSQRGREFSLAQPADIEDFGCQPGVMFSVGMRHYGKGEHVIAIVPSRYDPNQISGHPRKGWKRILIWVHVIGRANCANGFKKLVPVYAYVPRRKKHHKKPGTVTKVTKDVGGNVFPTPSGTFSYKATCNDGSGKSLTVVYTMTPQPVNLYCTVGKTVTVTETILVHPEDWVSLSPDTVTVPVTDKGWSANFLDQEKPPPPVNNPPPAPACYGSAAHLQTGGNAYLFCEVVLPTGATSISGESISVTSGPSGAYVNGLVPVDVRWDGTPCPSNTKCYRAHMWAGSEAGDLVMKFQVTANFSSGTPLATNGSVNVTVPIKPEVPFSRRSVFSLFLPFF